jgi:hypothetical protein
VVVRVDDAEVFIEVFDHVVEFLDFAVELVEAFPLWIGEPLDGAV